MAERITEAELLEALARATTSDAPSDARTGPELQKAMGVGEKKLRAALKALAAEGRLQIHRVLRQSVDGRTVPVQGYTITR